MVVIVYDILIAIIVIQNRHRRQESNPDYTENAGERYPDGNYVYEYDPNLKLSTIQPSGNNLNEEGTEAGVINTNVAVDPMSEAERAFLEENYR